MSMPVELAGFGGEHPLNFRILGGSCPETAKENTIWVDAGDVKHWVFSSSQPEAAAEGTIWIATGPSSLTPFNALKRNTLMLQPLTAKRFSGGAWEEMDAKIYHGGWNRFYRSRNFTGKCVEVR